MCTVKLKAIPIRVAWKESELTFPKSKTVIVPPKKIEVIFIRVILRSSKEQISFKPDICNQKY